MWLSGAIPANLMPMNGDMTLDIPGYRHHLQHLVSREGVGGVVVNGHAAEITSLTPSERRQAVQVAVEAVDHRVPVIVGVFAQTAPEAVQVAREAQAEGADGLLVFPLPALALGGSQEMGYAHIASVADAVDLPVVLFSYPKFTGMAYEPDTLAKLCGIESVCAVKEWSLDIATHERTLALVRSADHPISLLTSFSTNLLPALAVGADGILSGHGSVVAQLHAELLSLVGKSDLPAASALYERLQALTRVTYAAPMANMYARMKEQLMMLGHPITPAVRPPLTPVQEPERQALRAALAQAGLLAKETA